MLRKTHTTQALYMHLTIKTIPGVIISLRKTHLQCSASRASVTLRHCAKLARWAIAIAMSPRAAYASLTNESDCSRDWKYILFDGAVLPEVVPVLMLHESFDTYDLAVNFCNDVMRQTGAQYFRQTMVDNDEVLKTEMEKRYAELKNTTGWYGPGFTIPPPPGGPRRCEKMLEARYKVTCSIRDATYTAIGVARNDKQASRVARIALAMLILVNEQEDRGRMEVATHLPATPDIQQLHERFAELYHIGQLNVSELNLVWPYRHVHLTLGFPFRPHSLGGSPIWAYPIPRFDSHVSVPSPLADLTSEPNLEENEGHRELKSPMGLPQSYGPESPYSE